MAREGAKTDLESTEWWKAVLGEYPTAVSLVTALDPDGQPVGMIVGSFTAISQDPPLIGFFGDDASSTFQRLAGAERWAVSVLGEHQDDVLRAFIRKDAERFDRPDIVFTAHGVPRLADAVAWFEARTTQVDRHGDHRLVVGEVERFGVGTERAGSPFIYRRGGFGAFAVPSDRVDARLVGNRLAAAQAASEQLAVVADRIGRDIAIATMVGESVVVLAIVPTSAGSSSIAELDASEERRMRSIGISLPFAAPVEPLFAAWAPERIRSLWIERARHLVGGVDRRSVERQLAAIRERGYNVSVDTGFTERFYGLITDRTAERESYARMWSEYAARTIESNDPALSLGDIAAVQVPVFDQSGEVVLALTVSELAFGSSTELDEFAQQLIAAADALPEPIARPPRGRS